MKIKVKKSDVFIPAWNGNAEDESPIKVHYRFLTASERDDFIGVEPVKVVDGEPEITVRQDNGGLAKKMITRIENMEIDNGLKPVVIDDAAKLYNTQGVPSVLIKEIEGAMATATAVIDTSPLE